jgi:PKD repeat protein
MTDSCDHVLDPACGGLPVIDCRPNLLASVGVPYIYDEDGRPEASGKQPVSWSKTEGPESFNIDSLSGVISWVPDEAGNLAIAIAATNDLGTDICGFEVEVLASSTGEPEAIFSIDPDEGAAPLQVRLDGSQSTAPEGLSLVSHRWEPGDGSSWRYGEIVDHIYGLPGAYSVELRVTDEVGGTPRAEGKVRVRDGEGKTPPVANVIASATEGVDSLTVEFSCGCEQGSAPIEAYRWDFADGNTSSQAEVEHTFVAGRYRVRLTVVDGNSLSGTDTEEIVVLKSGDAPLEPPTCKATAAPLSGLEPLTVMYEGLYMDLDGQVDEVIWEFADGTILDTKDVEKEYQTAGVYPATFTVTDNDGLTCRDLVDVVVSSMEGKVPPEITSMGSEEADCGEAYAYDEDMKPTAQGTKPMSWSLGLDVGGGIVGVPEGMDIHPVEGTISWVPSPDQYGVSRVIIVVSNDAGSDRQDLLVNVSCKDKGAGGCGCGLLAEGGGSGNEFFIFFFWLALLLMGKRIRSEG